MVNNFDRERHMKRTVIGLSFLAVLCACVCVSIGVSLTTQSAYAAYGP